MKQNEVSLINVMYYYTYRINLNKKRQNCKKQEEGPFIILISFLK